MSTVELSIFIFAAACVGIYLAVDGIDERLVAWTTRVVTRRRPK